jgi:hypothetical protein
VTKWDQRQLLSPDPDNDCGDSAWPAVCSEAKVVLCAAHWLSEGRQIHSGPCSLEPWSFSWTWAQPCLKNMVGGICLVVCTCPLLQANPVCPRSVLIWWLFKPKWPLQFLSCTSHIFYAHRPQVASSCSIRLWKYKALPPPLKVLYNSVVLHLLRVGAEAWTYFLSWQFSFPR